MPVAAILGLVTGPGGLGYVMAMRPRGALKSPGYRSFVALAEQLLADGCTMVDLGGGPIRTASPKARLAPVAQPFSEILTASSPWLQQMFLAAFLGRSGAHALPLRSIAAAATRVAALWLPHTGAARGQLLHG